MRDRRKYPQEIKSRNPKPEHFLYYVETQKKKKKKKKKEYIFLLILPLFSSLTSCVCCARGPGISIDELPPYMVSTLFLERFPTVDVCSPPTRLEISDGATKQEMKEALIKSSPAIIELFCALW